MLIAMAEASVELIKRVPLFSGLSDRELKQIAQSMKERTSGRERKSEPADTGCTANRHAMKNGFIQAVTGFTGALVGKPEKPKVKRPGACSR
jgi:hypothetical protein